VRNHKERTGGGGEKMELSQKQGAFVLLGIMGFLALMMFSGLVVFSRM